MDPATFGDTVRRHRQRLGLSQEGLAEAAGIAVRSVRNMEAGRVAQPRPTTLRLLAGVFGIEVAELTAAPATAPAQLPREAGAFAGRADALTRLWTLLDQGSDAVAVISGAGGVGKTTLAVHWAHQAADQFPDGQLYANLHGFGPGDSAVDPDDVLADFLTALGVDRTAVPPARESRTALFRSRLAGRRVLIVLDNAREADQVRPLLPGAGACRVVVTSRNRLTGLIATDGAVPVPLDVLAEAEAGELLAGRLGAGRVAAEPGAVADIVSRCDRMPLALAIVAARAAVHPELSLRELADQLRDPAEALDALDAGDAATQIRAVFSWSYRALPEAPRRLFAMLGLHPGTDLEAYAAANLAGMPLAGTRRALADLVRLHLVAQRRGDRYGMHDLLRAYAAETAQADLSPADRAAAVARMLAFYRHTAVTAGALVHRAARIKRTAEEPQQSLPIADRDEAAAWIRAERANIVATAESTSRDGDVQYAPVVSLSVWDHWNDHGYSAECLAVSASAVASARRGTDPFALAYALSDMAGSQLALGRYAETVRNGEEARRLLHEHGDAAGERVLLGNLQEIYTVIGDLGEAQRCAADQLAIVRTLGQPIPIGESSVQLAQLNLHLGRLDEALAYAQEAVRIFDPTERTRDRGEALWTLGAVQHRRGEHHEARVTLLRAQEVFRSAGMNGNLLARVLVALGRLSWEQGQRQAAGRYLSDALDMAREFNGPEQMAEALTELGLLHAEQGRPEEAAAQVREALALATEVGTRREEIRARNALGSLLAAAGETSAARREFTAALELAEATESPYARGVAEAGLASLDSAARDGVA